MVSSYGRFIRRVCDVPYKWFGNTSAEGSSAVRSRKRFMQSGSGEDFRFRVEGILGEPIGHHGGQWLPIGVGDGGATNLRVEMYHDGLPAELIVDGRMDLLDLREGIGFRYAVEINSYKQIWHERDAQRPGDVHEDRVDSGLA